LNVGVVVDIIHRELKLYTPTDDARSH